MEYAQNNGQGALEVTEAGVIKNRFGEIMVYDSDGNLAPAPRAASVVVTMPPPVITQVGIPRFSKVSDAIDYAQNNGQGQLQTSEYGVITNQNGQTMVYDSDGNLAPATNPNATVLPTGAPLPYTVAVKHAQQQSQNKGQGPLEIQADGTVKNQYGETMVFDSAGNLAPAPRAASLAVTMPPSDIPQVGIPRFSNVSDAVDYAQKNGQGQLTTSDDGVITNRYGETMVYDSAGNLAPAANANSTVLPTGAPLPDPEALAQAQRAQEQNNGQGPLEAQADGTVKNQHGETMVLDSDGNLAPAPIVPVN